MGSQSNVIIRPGVVEDIRFIFNSWLKSYRDANAVAGVPNTLYFKGQHEVVERILARPGLLVLVACTPEDEKQILGYVVASETKAGTVLHWLYVKHPFRGFGIARELEKRAVHSSSSVQYSHRTKYVDGIVKRRGYIFNPFIES